MIYKKEPITNRIISFESEASIGAGFVNWVILTESEILAYELQEAKTSKISQLESARKEFQYKNIELNGETYVASKIACDNLSGVIDVMVDNNLVQTNWINANGEAIILTLVEARNLRTAMFSQQSSAYFQEVAFKEDINACTTIAELNAINITFQ